MTENQPLILIVDDNSINIDLLLNILKGEYRFGIAKNGAKALAYLDKNNLPTFSGRSKWYTQTGHRIYVDNVHF